MHPLLQFLRVARSWFPPYSLVGVGATTGFVALCLGTWALLPFNTFRSTQALGALNALLYEPLVGLLLVAAAIAGARSYATHNSFGVFVSTFVLTCVWVFLFGATVNENPTAPGVAIYFALMTLDTWVLLSYLYHGRRVAGGAGVQ